MTLDIIMSFINGCLLGSLAGMVVLVMYVMYRQGSGHG